MLQKYFISDLYDFLSWKKILFIGIVLRASFFLFTCFVPFPFGPAPPISPFHYQTGVDLAEYLERIILFTSVDGFKQLVNVYYETLILGMHPEIRPVGPLYPILLNLFDYSPQNTFSFSFLIFVLELSAFSIWCFSCKEHIRGVSGLLFAFMPHVIWFAVLISTDIFAYFFATILFALIFNPNKYVKYIPLICILLILTRPTGIVMCAVILFTKRAIFSTRSQEIFTKLFVVIIMGFGMVYYIPYFLVDQYLIDGYPEWKSIARTNFDLVLLFQKFFVIFGFHSSVNGLLVAEIIRFIYGVIFLTGFLFLIWTRSFLVVPVLTIFCFIWFYHIPSWRYMLPFLPIFVIYGGQAIEKFFILRK